MEGTLVGTVGLFKGDRPKTSHRSTIWGMYVDDDYRQQGIGDRLLDAAISFAKQEMKVATVSLCLEYKNQKAKNLYLSRSFKVWGTEPMAMKSGDQFFDEDHMVLIL